MVEVALKDPRQMFPILKSGKTEIGWNGIWLSALIMFKLRF